MPESSDGSQDESSIAESTDPDEMCDEFEVFGVAEPYRGEQRASSGDDSGEIDHFRGILCLCFKASLSVKPLLYSEFHENETACRTRSFLYERFRT